MKKIYIIWMVLVCLLFSACVKDDSDETGEYYLYQVNYKKGSLEKTEYPMEEEQEILSIAGMVELLSGDTQENIAVLSNDVRLLEYELVGDILKLNFNSNYRKITFTDEILCRAAIVKNFTQIPEVRYVQFFIEGEDLLDSSGNVIGLMKNSSFVEYSGENLADIQSKKLLLYFTDEAGDNLVSETRTVYYSSSAPVEKVIVEQLIQGPEKADRYATMPSNTGILGVSVSNGVVYVNLDQKFTGDSTSVSGDITIYSIVNSVLSAGNATKVQISINGDTKTTFKETVDLSQTFEFNFTLLEDISDDKSNNVVPQLISEDEK